MVPGAWGHKFDPGAFPTNKLATLSGLNETLTSTANIHL